MGLVFIHVDLHVRNHPPLLLYIIHLGRASESNPEFTYSVIHSKRASDSNPELTYTVNLTKQLALGILSLHSDSEILKGTPDKCSLSFPHLSIPEDDFFFSPDLGTPLLPPSC